MKTLKLLILLLIFSIAQQAVAQNILTHNNYSGTPPITFDITYYFTSCSPVNVIVPPGPVVPAPYCTGGIINSLKINFVDNTCSPPASVSLTFPFTKPSRRYSFTLCDGKTIFFDLFVNGVDYVMLITP